MTAREIYLTKRNRLVIDDCPGATHLAIVASLNKNLESIGYTLSGAVVERLLSSHPDVTIVLYCEIVPILRKMVGAHRAFKPMYPNFPSQVMEMDEAVLYLNALMHYWSVFVSDVTGVPDVIMLPNYPTEARPELQQEIKLKVIDLGTREDFEGIFTQLAGANSSLPEADKDILRWFVQNGNVEQITPELVPQKETLAILVSSLMQHGDPGFMLSRVKTATDVLRIISALSPDGDVSLAKPTKFRRLRRKERRFFLQALENCGEITEDMLRHKETWKRLGRELRPGDWAVRYPKAFAAFDVIRNDKPFATFNSKVESVLQGRSVDEILGVLQQRPGVFARRLDHAMRVVDCHQAEKIADGFIEVADKVSTPVLLQTYNHFKNRATYSGDRVFFPKGSTAKMQIDPTPLSQLPDRLTNDLTSGIRSTLVDRFKELPSLGGAYLDESLKQQMVPFAMRSASKSLKTISRGSRMSLPKNDVVRFFLWWKDGEDRTDIDLSAVGYDANWKRVLDISYYNLKDIGCAHSGDITSAPNGACEFIDLDVKAVLARHIRYVAMSIYSYTQQAFCDLPECFAGWMGRDAAEIITGGRHTKYAQGGEIFDARTVQDKVDLAASATVGVPVVFDLVERQVIWTDMALTSRNTINNGRSNGDRLSQLCKAMAELNRPNLHDLFAMHAEARGGVASKDQAKTVFSLHEGITPYDTDLIMSQFMQ